MIVTTLDEYLPSEPYPVFPADLYGKGLECPGTISWQEFIASESLKEMVYVDINDVALLQYISETTGRPKGAMLTHKNLLNGAFIHAVQVPNTVDSVVVTVLPLFHITSMNDHMLAWTFLGSSKYPRSIMFKDSLPKGPTGKVARREIKEEEATRRAQD